MANHATTRIEQHRPEIFRPGEMAPVSGIYRVVHKSGHRPAHEVMAIRGEHFPACRVCRSQVEFRSIRVISHMVHDWDFAGPNP